jgi:hypothetical protein
MTRINVYTAPNRDNPFQGAPQLEGWFTLETAHDWDEGTRWDGNNNISLATGSQWNHERLYRTASGRWVLMQWSQWENSTDTYHFIDTTAARDWLLRNEYATAEVEQITGDPIEEERGPGQPQIGTPVKATITNADLDQIDERITRGEWKTRSEAIRDLVSQALRTQPGTAGRS